MAVLRAMTFRKHIMPETVMGRHPIWLRPERLRRETCGDEVRLVTVNEAAAIARTTSLTVFRLVDGGALHYAETGAGELLVCTVSLRDWISR